MHNLNDIIQFQEESISIDFKMSPYPPEKRDAFIKDIMSMANADFKDDRYIIIGVEFKNKNRILDGVNRMDFKDSAHYQQIIRDNIEPDIKFDLSFHNFNEKEFAIFRIGPCDDRPYMMKRDSTSQKYKDGELKTGDMWIRVGDHQSRMLRDNLEKIYDERYQRFNGEIQITFENGSPEVDIPAIADCLKPSDIAKRNIKQALDRKLNPPQETTSILNLYPYAMAAIKAYNSFSYDDLSIDELEDRLKTAPSTFKENDEYFIFEELSQKVNLTINNLGRQYLEDVHITLKIPTKGVQVATKVHSEPRDSYDSYSICLVGPNSHNGASKTYPNVELQNSSIMIAADVGDVRHQIPSLAFGIPIRLALSSDIVGSTIEVTCTIYAKNLGDPRSQFLKIHVVNPQESEEVIHMEEEWTTGENESQ